MNSLACSEHAVTADLFDEDDGAGRIEQLGPQSVVLRGFATPRVADLLSVLDHIQSLSPFRHMVTPGGFTMSVALTNCGHLGWTTDSRGYRYTDVDPLTGKPWPAMPDVMRELAKAAASKAGFANFEPDACLINRYEPGARLTLHQDRNEADYDAPVVSVSLGVPATFLFGGAQRSDKAQRVPLRHGDVVVWGGVDRLRYHGVAVIKPAEHPILGRLRINFTFRKAG